MTGDEIPFDRRWHRRRREWCSVVHNDTDGTSIVEFGNGDEARVSTDQLQDEED